MDQANKAALLAKLAEFDTPTICNAIEVAQGQRGFDGFTKRTMHWPGSMATRLVGYARTAKIASAAPPTDDTAVVRERRRDYFRHMAAGPRPGVCVIEDMDGDDARGAWWGEVHSYVHRDVCGLAGAVTNGLVRDLGDLAPGFPVLAGGIGPSHGFVHVREFGGTVDVFGATVRDGDLIHADCHGMVVIPENVLAALPDAISVLMRSEAIVLNPIKNGPVGIDDFEKLWAQFEAART
ncbi:MAG: RraA family protein [Ahrensia sp.]